MPAEKQIFLFFTGAAEYGSEATLCPQQTENIFSINDFSTIQN